MTVTEIPNFDTAIFTSGYQSSSIDIESSTTNLSSLPLGVCAVSITKSTHKLSVLNVPKCDIAFIVSRDDTFKVRVVKRKTNITLMGCLDLLLGFEVPELQSATAKNDITRLFAVGQTREDIVWTHGNDIILDPLDVYVGLYVPDDHLLVSA